MDNIFTRLVTLTSDLSRRLMYFIEDLVFRLGRHAQDLESPFHGQHMRYTDHIHQSAAGDCPTVLKTSDTSATLRSLSSKTDPKEFFCMNISSSISNTRSFGNVSFILRGLPTCYGVPRHANSSTSPRHTTRFNIGYAPACCHSTGNAVIAHPTDYLINKFHETRPLLQHSSLRELHENMVDSPFTCLQTWMEVDIDLFEMPLDLCQKLPYSSTKGSSKDIGWLQRARGLPPVEDGTARFLEMLQGIRNGKHSLPNSLVYLLIPGLFSNHSPLYFVNTKVLFSKMGLACHIARINSEASVERNAWELKQFIEEIYWGSGKRVLLLGHSKGGIDAAAALSLYWSELKGKVAGLALVQCPYAGTPIASDILREGQIAVMEAWKIMEFIVCKLIKGDMRALEDLTYEKRKEFITKHRLPSDQIPIVSFHTEASVSPGVLGTMTRIAHAELPCLPLPRFSFEADVDSIKGSWKFPVVVPLTAAMAVSALHLWLRYGEKSDGLVTRRDAEVPGSVAIRLDHKLDHAWMVYSSWRKDRFKADACEMCEALLTLLVEIGNKNMEL